MELHVDSRKVSTTAGTGKISDSQLRAHPETHSVLNCRWNVGQDQSELSARSDDDDEEFKKPSTVGGPLAYPSRNNRRPDDTRATSSESWTRTTYGLGESPFASQSRSSIHILTSIGEDSIDTSQSSDTRTAPTGIEPSSRRLQSERRSNANNHQSSRSRPSRVQHQLGNLPNASLQSLISSLTTSSGSSGSSTATQKSYNRLAIRRRRATKRRTLKDTTTKDQPTCLTKSSSSRRRQARKHEEMEPSVMAEPSEGREVNANISRPSSHASRKDSMLSATPLCNRPASVSSCASGRNDFAVTWKRQETFNSDSGISVTSSPDANTYEFRTDPNNAMRYQAESNSSSEGEGSDEDAKSGLMPLPNVSTSAHLPPPPVMALPDSDPLVRRLQDQEVAMKEHMLHSPQPKRKFRPRVNPSHSPSPELPLYDPHATSAVPVHYPFPPPASAPDMQHDEQASVQQHYGQHPAAPQPHFSIDLTKKTVHGYELLAQELAKEAGKPSSPTIKPLYRKFEQLNHRVLLHLQDEIAELEEELRMLDETIAQLDLMSTPLDQEVQPASRRRDARFGSEYHFQRTQVLGKVFLKMQQYNQALTTYSASQKKVATATRSDLVAYRAWMDETIAIHPSETRFLHDDHENDLISPLAKSMPSTESASAEEENTRQRKQQLIFHYSIMLLILIAFSMLPGIFAKLLVFSIGAGCVTCIVWQGIP